jgi:putative NADPH-quinone reductase
MTQVLILFAHPALEKSRVHRRLVRAAQSVPGVTFHDLYEAIRASTSTCAANRRCCWRMI